MASLKAKELAKLSDKDLSSRLAELKNELIKVSVVNTQQKNTATIARNLKKNIARVLTVMRAKEA